MYGYSCFWCFSYLLIFGFSVQVHSGTQLHSGVAEFISLASISDPYSLCLTLTFVYKTARKMEKGSESL